VCLLQVGRHSKTKLNKLVIYFIEKFSKIILIIIKHNELKESCFKLHSLKTRIVWFEFKKSSIKKVIALKIYDPTFLLLKSIYVK